MKKINGNGFDRKHLIEQIAKRFENGDFHAFFQLLFLLTDHPDLPESTKKKISLCSMDLLSGKRDSIQDAFGLSIPTGAQRKQDMFSLMVYLEVRKERNRLKEIGNPNREDCFDNVANSLNLGSRGQIVKYYYAYLQSLKDQDTSD
ncbi:MAG: hypothetical protein N0C88_03785 [Candidatus Thiodiazotropha lotti]|uniref:Uncharacterized protein n=1 Tax=Candidatus Thiodiazotropha lotti TaxID=2792787 RepID=A0A9E4K3E6_9GAMM|nr:hypothetical protein [Candidatus Thiodiazotropha lotti]MCG7937961.1 hypothetical protein [Candidatus Thiodiazotropha lotti]MCW4202429.1 hypothetical protein [Candidatus Thiodiazotropha lotti]MCW4222599.1 hypothetical protein [Candidatus Thiodiazotropha lotti]